MYKKLILSVFVFSLLISIPLSIKAVTVDELQAQVVSLQQEVSILKSQLLAQIGSYTAITPTRVAVATYALNTAFSLGSTGYGDITSSPSGITCTNGVVSGTNVCSKSFLSGTSVTLTAKARSGSTFVKWTEDCAGYGNASQINITMTANKNCNALVTLNIAPAPSTVTPARTVVATAPTITTTPAQFLFGPGEVTLSGTYNDNGSPITKIWFEYGKTQPLGTVDDNYLKAGVTFSGSGPIGKTIILTAGTYFYKVCGQNTIGIACGNVLSFTILPADSNNPQYISTKPTLPSPEYARPSAVAQQVSPVFDRSLGISSRGEDVQKLQEILIKEGFLLAGNATGYFGTKTAAAVRQFQLKNKLEGVGFVGPMTRALLESKISKKCVQANWPSLLPQITNILTSELGPVGSVSILQQIDLTGDGCTEALVNSGVGGAYTSMSALMRMEAGQPVIAQKKESNSQINKVFIDEGASVKHQLGYKLLSSQNGFYSFQKEYDEQNNQVFLASCSLKAYVWNSALKLFVYNTGLSGSYQPAVCGLPM